MIKPGEDAAEPQMVERTGIALVHERERIFPADGSEAIMSPLRPSEVHYHFPVEIEVLDGGDEMIAERIYEALQRHIEGLG
jgi:hypothetical protein